MVVTASELCLCRIESIEEMRRLEAAATCRRRTHCMINSLFLFVLYMCLPCTADLAFLAQSTTKSMVSVLRQPSTCALRNGGHRKPFASWPKGRVASSRTNEWAMSDSWMFTSAKEKGKDRCVVHHEPRACCCDQRTRSAPVNLLSLFSKLLKFHIPLLATK